MPLTAEYNQIIANVAGNLDVPLWNLYVGLDPLPNEGIGPDGVHLNASPNGADLLDSAGNTILGMLGRASEMAAEKSKQALDAARELSIQLQLPRLG